MVNIYATMPVVAVKPMFQPLDEETAYASFEEAISARLFALQGRLSRTSDALFNMQSDTDSLVGLSSSAKKTKKVVSIAATEYVQRTRPLRLIRRWQRTIIFGGLALMFTLLGFDVMGLLVLHMH